MSAKKKVVLGLDDQGLKQSLEDDKQSVGAFGAEVDKANNALGRSMGQFQKAAESSANYKRQLGRLKREISDAVINYNKLSSAERATAEGQEMFMHMQELKGQAAEYADAICDVQAEIMNLASDTATWDSIKEGIGVGADAMSAMVALTSECGVDTEKLAAMVDKLAKIQTVANAAISVGNALQKQSSLYLGITAIQNKATAAAIKLKTIAETRGTIATKAATVAQRAFNLVASMNPYVLLATALLAAGAAIYAWVKYTNDATEAEKKHNAEIERQRQVEEHRKQTVADSVSTIIADYKLLQKQWLALKTDQEKNKFLEENKNKFAQMGLAVKSVADMEQIMVKQTSAVVAALKARAEAEAYGELYKEQLKKKISNDINGSVANGRYKKVAKVGDKPSADEAKAAGITSADKKHHTQTYASTAGAYTVDIDDGLNEEGVKKMNAYYARIAKNRRDEDDKSVKQFEDGYIKAMEKAQKAAKQLGNLMPNPMGSAPTDKGGSKNNKTNKTDDGPITKLKKQADDLKKKYSDGLLKITPDDYKKQLGDINKQIHELMVPLVMDYGTIDDMKKELQQLQKDYKDGVVSLTGEDFDKEVKKLNDAIFEREMKIAVDNQDISALQSMLNELQSNYANGLIQILPEDYKKQVAELQKKITDLKVQKGLELKVEEGSLADIEKKISEINAQIQVSADPKKLEELKRQLKELEEKRRVIQFSVEVKDLEKAREELDEIMNPKKSAVIEFGGTRGFAGAAKQADELAKRIDGLNSFLKQNKETYDILIKKQKEFLTPDEKKFLSIYDSAKSKVDALGEAYLKAADKANKLQLRKLSFEGFKSGIDAIGTLNSGIVNIGNSWKDMAENWYDMSPFEQATAVIGNTVETIQTAIGMYEAISSVIELFGEISAAASAKKVAADTAEMTSDTTKVATESANAGIEVANNQMVQASETSKMATDAGVAITSATASGASMPFPANLAAIAAGVAAVVAAIAMVASVAGGFENGGIIGGTTTTGDYNYIRANKGEAVLNKRQQAHLWNLLDGNGGGNRNGFGGEVKFEISGQKLVGVLNNYTNKKSKI